MTPAAGSVADATGNWVDTLAPAWSRPYLRLSRLDRPIGSWLLLFRAGGRRHWPRSLPTRRTQPFAPCAVLHRRVRHARRRLHLNDIVDRDLDAVERTAARPIPSGQVASPGRLFLVLQAWSVAVLFAYGFTIGLGIASRPGGDLSVHEADHLVAADLARPGVLLGRADGLGRRPRPARFAGAPALRRVDLLDVRL